MAPSTIEHEGERHQIQSSRSAEIASAVPAASVWLVPAGASVILLVLSILTYFIGVSRQDVYFGLRGLDWKLFPLERPDYIYLGAITTMDSMVTALGAVSQKWHFVVGTSLLGFLIAAGILINMRLQTRKSVGKKKLTKRQKDAIFLFATTLGMPALFLFPVLMLAIVLALPASIGDAVARLTVSRENAIIQRGCEVAPPYMQCFELKESTRVIAWGFLLHGAKDRVLLHDGANASMWSLEKRDLVRASEQAVRAIADNVDKIKRKQN